MKARTVVGRGEKGVFSDPGSELRLGREKKKQKCAQTVEGMAKKAKKKN